MPRRQGGSRSIVEHQRQLSSELKPSSSWRLLRPFACDPYGPFRDFLQAMWVMIRPATVLASSKVSSWLGRQEFPWIDSFAYQQPLGNDEHHERRAAQGVRKFVDGLLACSTRRSPAADFRTASKAPGRCPIGKCTSSHMNFCSSGLESSARKRSREAVEDDFHLL